MATEPEYPDIHRDFGVDYDRAGAGPSPATETVNRIPPRSWLRQTEVDAMRAANERGELLTTSQARALLDERDGLRAALIRQEYDVTEALAEALGMERDPLYGYPTGDHTAETLARSMVAYCAGLRGARGG